MSIRFHEDIVITQHLQDLEESKPHLVASRMQLGQCLMNAVCLGDT